MPTREPKVHAISTMRANDGSQMARCNAHLRNRAVILTSLDHLVTCKTCRKIMGKDAL